MIFSQDRGELRRMFANAWQKHVDHRPTSPLEAQIADVIAVHPEYHAAVTAAELDRDYTPDGGKTNPFLHMGLHLGLREQIATDRPGGIKGLYEKLARRLDDPHAAEHIMIDCLAETLWEAQSHSRAPDEQEYIRKLRRLTKPDRT